VLASEKADGTLPPGRRVPCERILIERFAARRTTIRQAIQNLIGRELVEITRGTGAFVAQPKISQELTELTGFVEDMRALGRHASARLLNQQIVPAIEILARRRTALSPQTVPSLSSDFIPKKRREIQAQFDGGAITSDGGGLLLREVEKRIGILRQLTACFTDYCNPDRIEPRWRRCWPRESMVWPWDTKI
jgi:DNA-binding GntR family transcriptional regulator